MAVGPVARARGHNARETEMKPANSSAEDVEDPQAKPPQDSLLLGVPSSSRLALLFVALALLSLLFFMSGQSEDDGDLAERRGGGAERLDNSPLLLDGFDDNTVAPLPKSKQRFSGHKAISQPISSAPRGRAPSPGMISNLKDDDDLIDDPRDRSSLLSSVHSHVKGAKSDEDGEEDKDGGAGIDEDDDADDDDDYVDPDADVGDDEDDDIVEHVDDERGETDEEMTQYALAMFAAMDENVDGKVTWSEFHRVVKFDQDFKDETTQEQKEDFRDIDTNGDNHISKEEMVHDWLRDDVEFGEGGDEDGEEGEEGDADGPSEASSGAKPIVKAPTKKPGANRPQGGAGAGAAEVADGGATLGQSIKNMAVRMFRSRAPKPKSINVMLYQAKGVRWSAADHHCRKMHKMICPMKAIEQLRLCRDKDPKHRGMSTPLDSPGSWVELDSCKVSQHGSDAAEKGLIACC